MTDCTCTKVETSDCDQPTSDMYLVLIGPNVPVPWYITTHLRSHAKCRWRQDNELYSFIKQTKFYRFTFFYSLLVEKNLHTKTTKSLHTLQYKLKTYLFSPPFWSFGGSWGRCGTGTVTFHLLELLYHFVNDRTGIFSCPSFRCAWTKHFWNANNIN